MSTVANPATPLTPYLCVSSAAKAIAFYQQAFGAREIFRLTGPDGKIGHAELEIGRQLPRRCDHTVCWSCKRCFVPCRNYHEYVFCDCWRRLVLSGKIARLFL